MRREEKGEIALWCLDGDRMPEGGKACTVFFEETGDRERMDEGGETCLRREEKGREEGVGTREERHV